MSEEDRVRWDARHRERPDPAPPSSWLVTLGDLLPRQGRAVDLAGGVGRHASWLADRGLDVLLCDVSPVALELARARDPRLGTLQRDLERDGPPPGPFELALLTYYLDRPLVGRVAEVLAPGGLFVMVHPTRRNLERNPQPGPRFLLDEGELPGLLRGLAILRIEEGWLDDRHEARLLARRP